MYRGLHATWLFVLAACSAADSQPTAAVVAGSPPPSAAGLDAGPPLSEIAWGEPLTGPEGAWQWVDVPDTKCRDGSPAGLSVNILSWAQEVVVYLEGGGACYDPTSCAANPAAVGLRFPQSAGIFDRADARNPVRDWSYVYVPYCSGDHHIGAAENVVVDGVPGTQTFLGRRNLERFLTRIVPTFQHAEKVLLTGVSAGGIGALMSLGLVQKAFGSTPVTMIDDSGPVLSTADVPACLNQLRRRYWGLDQSILAECRACDPDGNFMVQYAQQGLADTKAQAGLIHSSRDEVIRSFLGIATNGGANDCRGMLGVEPYGANELKAALLEMRLLLKWADYGFASYLVASTQHGWITTPTLYTQAIGEVWLYDWFRRVLDGGARDVDPFSR